MRLPKIKINQISSFEWSSFSKIYEALKKLRKNEIDALDILNLNIEAESKLLVVLTPEFLDKPIQVEFACRCAEEALKLIDNPDPASIKAIQATRDYMAGEISKKELEEAEVSKWDFNNAPNQEVAKVASWVHEAATYAVSAAICDEARHSSWVAEASSTASVVSGRGASREKQVEILKELIKEGGAMNDFSSFTRFSVFS